jgi:probable phosphoglycerate mutase
MNSAPALGCTMLLLRHGEITQAAPTRFVGQRDLPLTPRGRAQALAWSALFSRLPLAGAWCSDLARCRDTAALALTETSIAPTALPALREIHLGGWEGLTKDEVRQRFPGEFEQRGRDLANGIPSGGESFAQAQQRFLEALRHISTQASAQAGGQTGGQAGGQAGGLVLVVAHGGVIRAALCRTLGLRLDSLLRLGQDYCGLNILHTTPHGATELHAMNLAPGDAEGMLKEMS